MNQALDGAALNRLFREARSHRVWEPVALEDGKIRELYELAKWGPTSANTNPGRFTFVLSRAAKARLAHCLDETNVPKMMAAPCCVIVAWDKKFYELLPRLAPHRDFRPLYEGKPKHAYDTAFRNSTLQGAYLMIAARALGLNVGPMSGFDNEAVDREFFPDGRWRSNFLCNIGYARDEQLHPRLPRLEFDEACVEL